MTRVLGFASLGIFGRAVGLAQLLCGRVAGLLSLSIYPVLTQLTPGTDSFRRASAMYLRTIGWTVIPLAVLTSMLAGPIVTTHLRPHLGPGDSARAVRRWRRRLGALARPATRCCWRPDGRGNA